MIKKWTIQKQKYFGDIIDETGSIEATIANWVQKACGCYTQIKPMLRDLPLGKRRIESGLMLREAIPINGVLFNSEAWHVVTAAHIAKLQVVDNALFCEITKSH